MRSRCLASRLASRTRRVSLASLASLALLAVACTGRAGPSLPPGADPFEQRELYWSPNTNAARQAASWREERPEDAALMELLAEQPVAMWFGDWDRDITEAIRGKTFEARQDGALAVMVLYNIPNRDCGLHSAGGVDDADAYRRWIERAKRGIGRGAAVVILEPDALGLLDDCLSPAEQRERLKLLSDAVDTLSEGGNVAVYIDAGNAKWHPPEEMARRLRAAGVMRARGFALNVSNYVGTEETLAYGRAISGRLGDTPFIVDTSRNGNGPTADLQWCNPRGRAVGRAPTTDTGDDRVDAFLWIKVPGESDGACNGGPAAGMWWPEIALELARNGRWTNAALGRPPPEEPPAPLPEQPRPGPRR